MGPRLTLSFALLLLAGCASTEGAPPPTAGASPPPRAPQSSAFRLSDFAWSTAPGRGQIAGQLAFHPNGTTYSCASAGVVLTPETPWVRARMMILYRSADAATLPAEEVRGRTPPERNQDYSNFVRRAACDANGQFSFSGLPDGAWYAITVARPVQPATGREMALMRRVVVRNGSAPRLQF